MKLAPLRDNRKPSTFANLSNALTAVIAHQWPVVLSIPDRSVRVTVERFRQAPRLIVVTIGDPATSPAAMTICQESQAPEVLVWANRISRSMDLVSIRRKFGDGPIVTESALDDIRSGAAR
jgi:hypothetical protein